MCTVSWVSTSDGGFHLLCNRDEKKTRRPARIPAIHRQAETRYIAPTDGDAGGSWIAINELGLTLCLLNGANCGLTRTICPSGPFVDSRGLLPRRYIGGKSSDEVADRVRRDNFKSFAPFTLLALAPGSSAIVFEWNGFDLGIARDADGLMPLISSSFDTETVRRSRREVFASLQRQRGCVDSSLLYSFHEHHGLYPGPYSPCMHRADAETVSFSWVTVTPESVDFFYTPGAPCHWRPGSLCRLSRQR